MELIGIDKALKERGTTRQELAEQLNITPSGLGRYIRGEREAPYEVLKSICKFLNLSADYVLGMDCIETKNQASQLPDDEVQLLNRYRSLSQDGREILRAEALKMIKDYPQDGTALKAI